MLIRLPFRNLVDCIYALRHHNPKNPLLVSEEIFSVIFVVAGLVMLVLQFRAKNIDGFDRFGL